MMQLTIPAMASSGEVSPTVAARFINMSKDGFVSFDILAGNMRITFFLDDWEELEHLGNRIVRLAQTEGEEE